MPFSWSVHEAEKKQKRTKFVLKYKHMYCLCRYWVLPKSFIKVQIWDFPVWETQVGISSTGCFYLPLNESISQMHIQIGLHIWELIILSTLLFPFFFLKFLLWPENWKSCWPPSVFLKPGWGFLCFFSQCQISPSASFHQCTCFPILLTIVLYLLEAEGFVTCRQREAPSRCLPAAGPSSPPGLAHKGPLSSEFVCSCTKSESWALGGKLTKIPR